MFAHSLLALLQVHVQNLPEHRVANIFKPFASPASAEKNIALLTLAITGAIFLGGRWADCLYHVAFQEEAGR